MTVKAQHPQYTKFANKWKRCRDVSEGQDAVHEAGQAYLPSLKNQHPDDYQAYKARTPFFNATWRTIAGLSGMLMRKPPTVEVPGVVEPLLETVTNSGQPLGIFTMETVEECLALGRVGIMVDYPVANIEHMTQADAMLLNMRPTLARYKAESIINWRETVINNRKVLTMVVLEEEMIKAVDEFEDECQTTYRVLDLVSTEAGGMVYRVRVFSIDEKTGDDVQIGDDVFPLMKNKPLDFIPFYFLSTDDTDACPDDPPLIDLVDLNLSHYRTSADYEHGCHFTGLPTGYVTGFTPEPSTKIYLGSQTMLMFPDPATQVGFLEFSGAGLSCLKENMASKETQMAVLGARMLEAQKKGVESAETAGIHRAGENSMLASAAQAISLGMTKALQVFSDWAGGNGEVVFDINRDFFPMPMNPQTLAGLVAAWQGGAISKQTLFYNLQQGQVIQDDKDFETEEVQITDAMILSAPPPLSSPPPLTPASQGNQGDNVSGGTT
jgi:hypothetical protein